MADSIQEILNFIWPVADEILRDDFNRGKYPDIIPPFTVLRRLTERLCKSVLAQFGSLRPSRMLLIPFGYRAMSW